LKKLNFNDKERMTGIVGQRREVDVIEKKEAIF